MNKRAVSFVLTVAGIACCLVASAAADTSKSTNYQFDESLVGGSGLTSESSPNFQAGESIGDIAVGDSNSTNYQINSGYTTTGDPALAFYVNSATNFGDFSPSLTAVATSTFQVLNYTSYGYIVQIMGTTPTNGSHVIPGMASTGPPTIGTEQFGINLVANTSPITFGADPANAIFGVGVAATNYNTANNYRYVSGETIAQGPKSSGLTTYTISYIVNVKSTTPGGQYTSNQTLVCIGTY